MTSGRIVRTKIVMLSDFTPAKSRIPVEIVIDIVATTNVIMAARFSTNREGNFTALTHPDRIGIVTQAVLTVQRREVQRCCPCGDALVDSGKLTGERLQSGCSQNAGAPPIAPVGFCDSNGAAGRKHRRRGAAACFDWLRGAHWRAFRTGMILVSRFIAERAGELPCMLQIAFLNPLGSPRG